MYNPAMPTAALPVGPVVVLAVLAVAGPVWPAAREDGVTVPFVGCRSDGQAGPVPAPRPRKITVTGNTEALGQLAYYTVGGLGVLAPRGWHCFGIYGSSGDKLFVYPDKIEESSFFGPSERKFSGPVLSLAITDADGSGSHQVAEVVDAVLPAFRANFSHVLQEMKESREPAQRLSVREDTLVRKSERSVEFVTPPHSAGLGTWGRWLAASALPTNGLVFLGDASMRLVHLSVRLPKGQQWLIPTILAEAEKVAINH